MILFKISLGLETKMQMQLQKHEQLKHETNTIKKSNRKVLEAGLQKKKKEETMLNQNLYCWVNGLGGPLLEGK